MLTQLETRLPGLMRFESRRFDDHRGYFVEMFHAERFRSLGLAASFVQDNVSVSRRGVVRGIHLQAPNPQGKLLRVLSGAIWDVAVDLRRGSPTFGHWEGYELSAENAQAFFIPEGFGHGFVALSDEAVVAYKCTAHFHGESELTMQWDDPQVGIAWPAVDTPILSDRDRLGIPLNQLPKDRLTPYHAD